MKKMREINTETVLSSFFRAPSSISMDKFMAKPAVASFHLFKKPSASATKPINVPQNKLTEEMLLKQSVDPFLTSTFSHKAPKDVWESYEEYDNFTIANAIVENPEGGKVPIIDGMFEVRWGNSATSERMPITPSSGIIQVNLKSGNTRVVRWNDDGIVKPVNGQDMKQSSSSSVKRSVSSDLETPLKRTKMVSPSKSSSSTTSTFSSSNDGSPAMMVPNTTKPSSSPAVSSTENGDNVVITAAAAGGGDNNDIGPVTCCNWTNTTPCEEWCEKVMAQITDGGSIAVGLDCEWCAPWWAKAFGDAIQTIQLYHPLVGSLVYSTGCGDEKKKQQLSNHQEEELPSQLRLLLESKQVLKVGVNVHGDTCRIANTFQCEVLSAYNLMNQTEGSIKRSSSLPSSKSSSKAPSKGGGSLEQMSKTHCPVHLQLDKKSNGSKVRMGDWSAWPLSADQEYYAAMDAVVSYWIFSSLMGAKWPQQSINTLKQKDIANLPLKDAAPTVELQRSLSDPLHGESAQEGGGAEEGEGKVSGVSLKAVANAAFFMMHRNKSIKPPNAGIKEHPQGPPTCLKNYVVVISGVLDSFSRKEFETYISNHGGTCVKSITKKITHLVNDHGEIGPSKKAKCEEMKVDIVGEDFFIEKVKAAM